MTDRIFADIMTIATAIIGLAIIATLVSKNANTANVVTAGGNVFSQALGVAESPVTGQSNFNVAGTYSSAGFMN